MLKFMAIATASLLIAVPASAQTAPAAPAPSSSSSTDKAKDPNRIICERQDEIGSRLGGGKVCHTAAEWDQLRKANREQVEDWQRTQTSTGKPGT